MKKVLNRNHLKLIGCLTMLIDHIGFVFFPEIRIFRIIGRIAFPLFAFFVAEGMYYSKSRKNYQLAMLIFALVSQIPYFLLFGYKFNIMFTFLLAMQLIIFYDKTKINNNYKSNNYLFFVYMLLITIILSLLGIIDYGFWGVMLVFFLYVFKNNTKYRIIAMATCLIMTAVSVSAIFVLVQLVSLLAIPLILIYNGEKGKGKYKYAFYLFYPVHIAILYIFSLFL